MNVIVWGCGNYGRNLIRDVLLCDYNTKLNIVGFGDKRAAEMDKCDVFEKKYLVYTYAQVKELYEDRIIDAVIIAVKDANAEKEIRSILGGLGIPSYNSNRILNNLSVFDIGEKLEGDVWIVENANIQYSFCLGTGIVSVDKRIILEFEPRFLMRDYFDDLFSCNSDDYICTTQNCIHVEKACFLAFIWTYNYWHFIFEVLPSIYELERIGFNGKYIIEKNDTTVELMRILAIKEERIIWISKDNSQARNYRVDKLYYVDSGHPQSRRNSVYVDMASSRIVDLVKNKKNAKQEYPQRIYFKRIGRRKLVGVDEILSQYGFVSVIPEEHSIEEEIMLFCNADIAVVPFGAAITNAIFMKPNARVVDVFSSRWINTCCIEVLNRKNIKYHMITSNSVQSFEATPEEDYYCINPTLLDMTLKQILE